MAETIPPPTDADRQIDLAAAYSHHDDSIHRLGDRTILSLIRLLAEERRLRDQAESDVERLSLKVNDLRQQLDARRKSEANTVAENERLRADLAEAVEALVLFAKGMAGHIDCNCGPCRAAAIVAKHKWKQ